MTDAPEFATVGYEDLRLIVEHFGKTEAQIFADRSIPNFGAVVEALQRLRNYLSSERFKHLDRLQSERETLSAFREMALESGLVEVEPGHFVFPGERFEYADGRTGVAKP